MTTKLISETHRLFLRPVEERDASDTARLVTSDVASQLSTWPSPMSPSDALNRIHAAQELEARREAINLAITLKPDGQLMGWLGFASVAPHYARIGYWLGTSFRGRGYMREAISSALPAASDFLEFHELEALVLPGNEASISLLDSVGFQPAGETDEFIVTTNQTRRCFRFLLKLPV